MMKRRKVNNLCRCTPKAGIIALHPDYARSVYDHELRHILLSDNPGFIAGRAIQTGDILRNAGRPLLALRLMRTALSHLLYVDDELQRDYAHEHYCPANIDYRQWYHPWSARVSEVDARRLAAHIDSLQDEVNSHLGEKGASRLRFRVHRYYESLFEDIYEV
ncbi:MAG: hypothetical protein IJT75_09940 [Bacteroidaceae bacterium]|nr:hypothetical protein [Bacteroidaceae bacterium]